MALGWRHGADSAVAMLQVVPMGQVGDPAPRGQQVLERLDRQLRVLKVDSTYGLSLLMDGRLRVWATPRRCMVASMVSPFMGAPLSECTVS
jgi:hypothetical protein